MPVFVPGAYLHYPTWEECYDYPFYRWGHLPKVGQVVSGGTDNWYWAYILDHHASEGEVRAWVERGSRPLIKGKHGIVKG